MNDEGFNSAQKPKTQRAGLADFVDRAASTDASMIDALGEETGNELLEGQFVNSQFSSAGN